MTFQESDNNVTFVYHPWFKEVFNTNTANNVLIPIDKKIKKSEKHKDLQPNFFISYPDFVGLQGFAIQFPTSNEFLVPFWPNLLEASHDGIRTPRPCICRSNKSVSSMTFLKIKICG